MTVARTLRVLVAGTMAAPWLELRARFDHARASRSADVALTQNGQYRGSIAQPEHLRQAVTFTVSAIY